MQLPAPFGNLPHDYNQLAADQRRCFNAYICGTIGYTYRNEQNLYHAPGNWRM